jgi:hypothetical protein
MLLLLGECVFHLHNVLNGDSSVLRAAQQESAALIWIGGFHLIEDFALHVATKFNNHQLIPADPDTIKKANRMGWLLSLSSSPYRRGLQAALVPMRLITESIVQLQVQRSLSLINSSPNPVIRSRLTH